MDAFITRKRRQSSDKADQFANKRNPSISPPPKRKTLRRNNNPSVETIDLTKVIDDEKKPDWVECKAAQTSSTIIPSPIQLNYVQDLAPANNVDTVKLSEILGNPMIKECWLFNYLFDIDFIMKQFDPDTKDTIHVRVVHGSWKAEDRNGIGIIDGARRYPNIQVIKAYMAEAYGTHHSKMIVLFRHDDLAQVIILTANFIERDWSMSQAIWRTPLLPLAHESVTNLPSLPPLGSGPRFKHDLIAYFRGYGPGKLQDLISQLQRLDFAEVRGALIASVPGKQNLQSMDPDYESLWGWPGLRRILGFINSKSDTSWGSSSEARVVAQISSVAAVGEKWLTSTFFPALSVCQTSDATSHPPKKPQISIMFPTADEIRRSVDGYAAGPSIHMKISTPTQAKQLDFLMPMLCHWAGEQKASFFGKSASNPVREAGRRRAAPHIKTYIRFSDASMKSIDWAMVTSANLSTQAWGAALAPGGEVRICSYEIGVVTWPALWDGEGRGHSAVMVPVFKTNTPVSEEQTKLESDGEVKVVVGWRMPYDLPLVPYAANEKPWCASEPCNEPDWTGRAWPGYEK